MNRHEKRRYVYRLDSQGRWYFGRNQVTDPELEQSFFRWLRQDEAGGWFMKCEGEYCSVMVEDAPQFVTSIRCEVEPGRRQLAQVILHLSSGNEESLNPQTLRPGRSGALYCTLSDGMMAKFHREPQLELGRWVDDDLGLTIAGKRWEIPGS